MSSRKKVLKEIAAMEKKLLLEEAEVELHESYFTKLLRDNRAFITAAILIPALAAGWKSGGLAKVQRLLKRASRVVWGAAVTTAKSKMLQTIVSKTSH